MWRLRPAHRHRPATPPADAVVAAVAARQGGVVSVRQLRAAGLDANAVARRVAAGRLHPVVRNVYAVGHTALGPDGPLFAAALSVGEGVISHRSAAALWGFAPVPGVVDVLTTRRGVPRAGIRIHRTRDLPPEDLAVCRDVPVTSVARTLVDLAAVADVRTLRRAVHEAEVLRLLDVRAVEAVLDRSNGRCGTGRLRRLITVSAAPTRTELEARFLDLCRDHGIPMPAVNALVCGYEVDFYWAPERLAVETDGAHVHDTLRGFEEDRRRDVELGIRGIHVARFTWRRVVGEPSKVAADVMTLLAMRANLLGVVDRSRQAG